MQASVRNAPLANTVNHLAWLLLLATALRDSTALEGQRFQDQRLQVVVVVLWVDTVLLAHLYQWIVLLVRSGTKQVR